jgi:hypothetical protein
MKTINVYTIDELSEEVQNKVINKHSDINVSDSYWYDNVKNDAKEIGLLISSFDIYRRSIKGKFKETAFETAVKIKKNHGENCKTYKTAINYLTNYDIEFKQFEDENRKGYCAEDKEEEFDEWLDNFDQSFLNDLLQDYLKILQDEYDYLTSIEAIKETIRINDYLFTENGTMI